MDLEMNMPRFKNGGQSWTSDDVSGAALDVEKAKAARELEMQYFRKMRVCGEVPRTMAKQRHKLVRIKLIDTNKGDHDSLDYRSRLVAMEFHEYSDPTRFAATPPIESIRFIMHRAATNQASGRRHCVMTVDVSRADFNAASTRDVYTEIPKEDRKAGDQDKDGKLRKSLYGTKGAAHSWLERVANQLKECGYVRGKALPAVYFHRKG